MRKGIAIRCPAVLCKGTAARACKLLVCLVSSAWPCMLPSRMSDVDRSTRIGNPDGGAGGSPGRACGRGPGSARRPRPPPARRAAPPRPAADPARPSVNMHLSLIHRNPRPPPPPLLPRSRPRKATLRGANDRAAESARVYFMREIAKLGRIRRKDSAEMRQGVVCGKALPGFLPHPWTERATIRLFHAAHAASGRVKQRRAAAPDRAAA